MLYKNSPLGNHSCW